MKLSGIEKLAICGQALNQRTFRNCYRFWRHVEGCGCMRSAFMAAVGLIRRGD